MKPRNEQQLQEVFRLARSASISAPSHLETQVLARFHERQMNSRNLFVWKALFASVVSFCFILVVLTNVRQPVGDSLTAEALSPQVVKLDLAEIRQQVAQAEVILPEGVQFYSKSIPEIRNQRTLSLDWTDSETPGVLPFVITSEANGTKVVKVRFWNTEGKLVTERNVSIEFLQAREKRGRS